MFIQQQTLLKFFILLRECCLQLQASGKYRENWIPNVNNNQDLKTDENVNEIVNDCDIDGPTAKKIPRFSSWVSRFYNFFIAMCSKMLEIIA